MGSVLTREFLDDPRQEFENQTPNQVIEKIGVHRVIDLISTILGIDLDTPMKELSDRIPADVYRQKHGEIDVYEALLKRLSRLLVQS